MTSVVVRGGNWDPQRDSGDEHAQERPCKDTEKLAMSKPWREASEESRAADTSMLDFQPLDSQRIDVC